MGGFKKWLMGGFKKFGFVGPEIRTLRKVIPSSPIIC